MIIKNPAWFVRDNLFSPVVKMGTLANGDLSYTLDTGLTYHIDEAGRAYIGRLGYTPRLSKALREAAQPLEEATHVPG